MQILKSLNKSKFVLLGKQSYLSYKESVLLNYMSKTKNLDSLLAQLEKINACKIIKSDANGIGLSIDCEKLNFPKVDFIFENWQSTLYYSKCLEIPEIEITRSEIITPKDWYKTSKLELEDYGFVYHLSNPVYLYKGNAPEFSKDGYELKHYSSCKPKPFFKGGSFIEKIKQ
jgi:hypothetical protein